MGEGGGGNDCHIMQTGEIQSSLNVEKNNNSLTAKIFFKTKILSFSNNQFYVF